MSLFTTELGKQFLDGINRELIGAVIGQNILYYRIDIEHSKVDSLYGESISKTYQLPVQIYCLVSYEEPTTKTGLEGTDTSYTIECQFLRSILRDYNLYPREGDIVLFGEIFYEIMNVHEIRLIEGKHEDRWDVICKCQPTRLDQISLVDYHN